MQVKKTLKAIDTKDLIYIFIIVIVCLLLLKSCIEKKKQRDVNAYNEQVHKSELKSYIDKYNREVTLRENIFFNSTKELKKAISQRDSLRDLAKKFNKVNTVTEVKTITKIQKDTIVVKDSVLVNGEYYYMFEDHQDHYNLYATLSDDNLVVDSLEIPNTQTAIIGSYKPSFFGKSKLTTSVTNSNPLVETVDMSTLQVEVPKKWYEKGIITIPLGIVGGFLIWEAVR